MADHYVQFSTMLENLSPVEIAWWKSEASRIQEEIAQDYDATEREDNCEDFDVEGASVWFHSDEYGNPDKVANIVQRFLKLFRPTECFTLEWACTCSKQRIGEFSGGAVFICASGQDWLQTGAWVQDRKAEFNGPTITPSGQGDHVHDHLLDS